LDWWTVGGLEWICVDVDAVLWAGEGVGGVCNAELDGIW